MRIVTKEEQLARSDAEMLLALLNSAPIAGGVTEDALAGDGARAVAERLGGSGTEGEVAALRRARGMLWRLVRHEQVEPAELEAELGGVSLLPHLTADGLEWELDGPSDAVPAARAVMAWADVDARHPGRLRPCANSECNLFLLDRSRPGTARWCSMATCGNRMKARAYASRSR